VSVRRFVIWPIPRVSRRVVTQSKGMTSGGEDQIASLVEITEDCCSCALHFLPIVLATQSLIHLLQENRLIQSVHVFSYQIAERRRRRTDGLSVAGHVRQDDPRKQMPGS